MLNKQVIWQRAKVKSRNLVRIGITVVLLAFLLRPSSHATGRAEWRQQPPQDGRAVSAARGVPTGGCAPDRAIQYTFLNGASWRLCWEWRYHEGIVLRNIYYTSPLGAERKVLKEAAPAELQVSYDNGSTYYLDVSQEGLGIHQESLALADCPGGKLYAQQIAEHDVRMVLCQLIHQHGYASKRLQDVRYLSRHRCH
ncbi:MAG: hypothetical protein R2911_38530 [Caldilineaceae bacterium]